jgi:hypothetical protein
LAINNLRRRVSNFFLDPETRQKLSVFDKNWEDITLKLQRATQQLNALTNDVGQYKGQQWDNLAQEDYNPEEIGLEEYTKMLDYDSQVIAGWDLIQMGMLMKDWRVVHTDQEIVTTITQAFRRMRWPSIRESMKEMTKALVYGYSVTEVVFDDYKGWWMPRRINGLKTFDPESIRFYTDSFGNLLRVGQRITSGYQQATAGSYGRDVTLPLYRTLLWSHEKEWGNWYGKSILRGCYKNWYIKDAMLKFANIAYERFGSPILLGIAPNDTAMRQVMDAIQHLYARSQAVIKKGDPREDPTAIEVIESKRTEMPFDRYIRYHDEMILRRMLIGETLFSGGGSTYGPKVPMDLMLMRFEDFRLELTSVMNDLLKMITDLNWSVDEYPKFVFAPLTTMDQAAIVQKLFDAIDKQSVFVDEPWVRDELNFPPPSEEIQERLRKVAVGEALIEEESTEPEVEE